MGTFKTTDGAEWVLAVSVGTIKRVREETGINLLALVSSPAAVADVFHDDVRLAEVLAAVVKPQLDQAGRSLDAFFSCIDGTVVEQGAEALLREIANFFQEPRRTVLLKAMDKAQAANKAKSEAGAAAALEAIEAMEEIPDPASILTSSVSSSPASAA